MSSPLLLRIAVATPLSRSFDYLPPADCDPRALQPGIRLRVPFGRGHGVGILLGCGTQSQVPVAKLRVAHSVLDSEPLFDPHLLELLQWASDYYAHPLGEVLHAALPAPLRQGEPLLTRRQTRWRYRLSGDSPPPNIARAPLQTALLRRLQSAGTAGLAAEDLATCGANWRAALQALIRKQWVESFEIPWQSSTPVTALQQAAPIRNAAQTLACETVIAALGGFARFLLEGVTGSGKTEVYLQIVAAVLEQGRQALVLVPEIGLTPQLVARFQARFPQAIGILHSRISDRERQTTWQAARAGELAIILGTRSAIFTPLARPGVLIVDEEHDSSYKQQDSFRYHARDLAVMRAKLAGVPIILGSATPALESLENVRRGHYQHLWLPERAGGAKPPHLQLLDLRRAELHEGLAESLLARMREHLANANQVLLFLNRRGFAPVILCHACGWTAECPRCDRRLTYHLSLRCLLCHHCGYQSGVPTACPSCAAPELRQLGLGTERLAAALSEVLPEVQVIRIDRDSTRSKGALENHLATINRGLPCVLIGTQMLAKGHHFPKVTLVGIVDADCGLYSSDFRAAEQLAQQIIQVAGRAGRAAQAGEVLIQTHNPHHPLLQELLRHGYKGFAEAALAERELTRFPPFARLALLRAEAHAARGAQDFLLDMRARLEKQGTPGVTVLGPVPALIERLAGRYRAQLLLHAEHRQPLHQVCKNLRLQLETDKRARRVRWALDIDPIDLA